MDKLVVQLVVGLILAMLVIEFLVCIKEVKRKWVKWTCKNIVQPHVQLAMKHVISTKASLTAYTSYKAHWGAKFFGEYISKLKPLH